MQSAAGFRAVLVVAVVAVEMAVLVMVPAVSSVSLSMQQDLSRGGNRKALYTVQSSPDSLAKIVSTLKGPERREQFLKILMSLEELHRSINSTVSNRITMMPRANARGKGKKNKVVVSEEAQTAATAPPMESGTISAPSDRPPDPQGSLGGKGFKKSLSQNPKKPNKRVCFWKYCSQN